MFKINYEKEIEIAKDYLMKNDRIQYIEYIKLGLCMLGDMDVVDNIRYVSVSATNTVSKIELDDIPIMICSNKPVELTRNITNAIFKKTNIVVMNTVIPYKELTISVNFRKIFNIRMFPSISHKSTDIQELLIRFPPSNITINTIPVKVLHPDISISRIYHKLYQPCPGDWKLDDLHLVKSHIIKTYKQLLSKKMDMVSGGSHIKPPRIIHGYANHIFNDLHDHDISTVHNLSPVLIGSWALHYLKYQTICTRIQLLISIDIDIYIKHIEHICSKGIVIDNVEYMGKICYRQVTLHTPYDYYLKKYEIYVEINKVKYFFMDVYNSLSYEIIPLIPNIDIRIAGTFVLCRFMMLDIWYYNVVPYLTDSVKSILINQRSNEVAWVLDNLDTYAFTSLYTGIYIDPVILYKKVITDNLSGMYPYVPYKKTESHK